MSVFEHQTYKYQKIKMNSVFVIDDDERIRDSLKLVLEDDGFEVTTFESGEALISALEAHKPDIFILDLMLPKMTGFECAKLIRQKSNSPILMVSARSDTHDVVAGLEAGADDYITKPFAPKELTARMKAHLRRAKPVIEEQDELNFGALKIQVSQGLVYLNEKEIYLTKTEFKILTLMAQNPNKIISREDLLEKIWGYDWFGDTRLVDTHIRRLRAKIEEDTSVPKYISTSRGLGYKFIPS